MKYIFVTGGICSSVGKGIAVASIGLLLKAQGLKVLLKKYDPYLNIDPGTMNPFEHGEVFVTNDGAETDLDLGHYERFINENLTSLSNVTAGKIYQKILKAERVGKYLGRTVQVIPHVTNAIKKEIYAYDENNTPDVIVVEIGGTVGDLELSPFLETIRQIVFEKNFSDTCLVHVALLPYLFHTKELKTKPLQHSVKTLNSLGLFADVILARSHTEISKKEINKLAMFCNVAATNIVNGIDIDSIYKIPIALKNKNLHKIINKKLNLNKAKELNLTAWNNFLNLYQKAEYSLNIAVIGKYTENKDAYLSINEALQHAALASNVQINIDYLAARLFSKEGDLSNLLQKYHGIIVPGGFGVRDIEGKIKTIQYCRENNVPFLGICLGMQLALIEYARNVLKISDANTCERDENGKNLVINFINNIKNIHVMGGTLRLGAYPCILTKGSQVQKLYGTDLAIERHRHRYEVALDFVDKLESKNEIVFSGYYKDDKRICEIFENLKHDYFIGCQFHPEFMSRPVRPHPLFLGIIRSCLKNICKKS